MTEVPAQPAPLSTEAPTTPPAPKPDPNNGSKKTTIGIIGAVIIVLVVIGLAYWTYTQLGQPTSSGPTVTTYDECVQAGGELTEGAQPQCQLENGQVFVALETPVGVLPTTQAPLTALPQLIQECPEKLVVEMIEVSPPPAMDGQTAQAQSFRQSNEYFILNGEQLTRVEVDVDWVGQNCQVTTETVFQ